MFDREGRLILAHLQDDFPLDPQPYEALSRRLHIPVSRIRSKVQMFCRKGIIRYIGAVVDTKKAGFRSGLVALAVPASRVNAVSKIINNYRQVTHNYLRQGEFNMWFTVICRTERMRAALVSKIRRDTGISMCLDLPTRKVFKIDARFALLDGAGLTARLPMHKKKSAAPHTSIRLDNRTLSTLANALDITDRPFLPIAKRLACTEDEVVALIDVALRQKLIRRFGAVLDHYKIGLKSNALVAWQVEEDDLPAAAKVMEKVPNISHCYWRRPGPNWPYSLYTMLHAPSRLECLKILQLISGRLGTKIKDMKVLFTLKELKKTRFDAQRIRRK